MSIRLSGWQRLGIIASVLWALGCFIYMRGVDADEPLKLQEGRWKICNAATEILERADPEHQHGDGVDHCDAIWDTGSAAYQKDVMDYSISHKWKFESAVALSPIPFGWLLA